MQFLELLRCIAKGDYMVNSLNNVLLEGNLVRDPLVNTTPNNKTVCNFSVAVNRYYKKGEETVQDVSYFDIEVWEKLAENCGKYLQKGKLVRVSGRLKQDRWEDDEGKGRSRIYVVGDHVDFQGRRKPPVKKEKEKE